MDSSEKKGSTILISILKLLVKLCLAGSIVWYLLLRNPEKLLNCFAGFSLWFLPPAMLLYGLHMVYCAWRWRELAGLVGIKLSFVEALSVTMQGYFFSLVIPGGAIGGDVVKMGLISSRSQTGMKTEGAFTVLMDRIVGMIALFVLTLVILVPAWPILMQVSIPDLPLSAGTKSIIIIALAAGCFAGIGISMVVFFHRFLQTFRLFAFFIDLGNRLSHNMLERMMICADQYRNKWKKIVKLVIGSILWVHIMTALPFFFLLAGLGTGFSWFAVIAAVTIGNIIGLLPVFPAGVGGRDVAVVTILAAGNVIPEEAKAAMLIYTAILLFFNLLGGVFFVFDKGKVKPE